MNSSAIGECVVKQCAMKYTAEVTPLMKVDWVMAELSAQHFGIGSVSEFAEEELAGGCYSELGGGEEGQ